MIDDDVLGKAYDARLMRRLLDYLRPYRSICGAGADGDHRASMLQLAQPYLMKLAIDRYITAAICPGSTGSRGCICSSSSRHSASSSHRRGCCR